MVAGLPDLVGDDRLDFTSLTWLLSLLAYPIRLDAISFDMD